MPRPRREGILYDLLAEARADYNRRRSRASNYTKKPEVRAAIFGRDDNHCRQCGATDHLTVDHIIAVYRGGTDEYSNLQTLCGSCNSRKAP